MQDKRVWKNCGNLQINICTKKVHPCLEKDNRWLIYNELVGYLRGYVYLRLSIPGLNQNNDFGTRFIQTIDRVLIIQQSSHQLTNSKQEKKQTWSRATVCLFFYSLFFYLSHSLKACSSFGYARTHTHTHTHTFTYACTHMNKQTHTHTLIIMNIHFFLFALFFIDYLSSDMAGLFFRSNQKNIAD